MKQENGIEERFIALDDDSNVETLHSLFKTICIFLELNPATPQVSLLDQNNNNPIKKHVASYLLRALSGHSKLLWDDSSTRHKAITLFNDVLCNQIYKILKIDEKNSSHEIFAGLQAIHANTIGEFEKIKVSIVSMETAINARRGYIKLISSPLTTIFSESQIYDQSLVSKERINEFFNAIEQYSQADRVNALTAFTRLEEIYRSYISDIQRHGSNIYVSAMIENILESAFVTAQMDFNHSGLQKPVVLSLKASERKYPLHAIGESFPIKVYLYNSGPGVAFDTIINILESDDGLEVESDELSLGTVDAGRHEFIIKAHSVAGGTKIPKILGILSWADYKGKRIEVDFEIEVVPQNGTLNWDEIKRQQPYSLESVDSEADLVGRKDLLEDISSKLSLRKGESSIIYGQKRVGKTSLARTIQHKFEGKDNHATVFIETGSLDKTSPSNFINTLGKKITKNLRRVFSVEIDDSGFASSLYPLVSYIEDIVAANKKARIIIILDEFDEIPSQLYPYTEEGNSFFHNLRSLSGESGEGRVSLILVGGENMSVIMQSTDKLNKFDASNVGYFNKSEYWEDFKELVTAPVRGVLEYSDEAILKLYEVTEGNPFYTKFVAKTLYKKMCERRCSFISIDEMEDAIHDTIVNMEAINLNHFWSDGIRVEDTERRDTIETQRRRLLIAFADKLRENSSVEKTSIVSDLSLSGIPSKEILESFISRNIIVEEEGLLRIKPRLFERWLTEKGVYNLRASFADEDAQTAFNEKESAAYISESEIITLSDKWEHYRGAKISPSHIRAWLDQFENNIERRMAFKLLLNLDFYGESKIREKLKIVHDIVRREVVHTIKAGERVRKDILVSAFGALSKSGPTYIRMYATENGITAHSIKAYNELQKGILGDENIKALVFIDDMVASGGTVIGHLDQLNLDLGEILGEREILVVVGVICGTGDGIENCQNHIDNSNFPFKIVLRVCDVIDGGHKVFAAESKIFEDHEVTKALSMARKYGARINNRHPLGYHDGQLLIVFKDNCPNNSLPIIWGSANDPKWTPLFKRN
ncbi:hypothetical protein PspCFBP13509_05520 [Pseudomonas sp. CFBP13509]|uniref:phosphoribosyltransferase-like protein n=1 Tax=Pseudomonas sp. CFBP13509 TaxID=2184008 RepID=UPI0010C05310|nr:ATP-binding protein [Pseudomonas sp. CFBP13509]TKJ81580.1 hypothetical protein PspCFBP13509_05520 [Pseudomonas sp. CFBP13509]